MFRCSSSSRLLGLIQRCCRNGFKSRQNATQTATARTKQTCNVLGKTLDLQSGHKLHGYTVKKVVPLDELYMVAVYLHHDKTGAQHLHLARDDSNNTFSVMFRTTPMDSTGVAHILEHTTLCGSKRFPVRDPFFKMLNRSLATFMNAFTASDWTMYPFSTQNQTDFENLLHVYLDSVFNPQLRELDFLQEGWRLEHEDQDDTATPIIFKGVVYNEMKGVFSNPQNHFVSTVQRQLLPSHTYSVESGGDPHYITDLTWDHLKKFHATHYHPSNARFMTYGDRPLEDSLSIINDYFLSGFDRLQTNTEVPLEQKWNEPRQALTSCRPEPMSPDPDKQTTIAVSYLLGDITDVYESFVVNLISTLLVDGDTSPFYQSLLEANIGSDYCPILGYQGDTRNAYFTVGLQGIPKDSVSQVEKIIKETLDTVFRDGFPAERIDALLHRIELGQKHQSTNFGLKLAIGVSSCWNHDGDPIELLKVSEHVDRLKDDLATNPTFIQDKIKQYFQDNSHKLSVTMTPDDEYEMNLAEEEKNKLDIIIQDAKSKSDDFENHIYQRGEQLAVEQNRKEDFSCLPTLKVQDIDRQIKSCSTMTNDNVQYCAQPTNGVTYLRTLFDVTHLKNPLKPYLNLFCNLVARMGTEKTDYKTMSQRMELTTGGIDASYHVLEDPHTLDSYHTSVVFTLYCLDKNMHHMLNLLEEILNLVQFDDDNRLTTMIQMVASDLACSIPNTGHSYAMGHAASHLMASSRLRETLGGLDQISFMKSIAQAEDLTAVKDKLRAIAGTIIDSNYARYAINTTPDQIGSSSLAMEKFIRNIPQKQGTILDDDDFGRGNMTDFDENDERCVSRTFYEMPFSVNYAGQSYRTVPYVHDDFARLRVLASLMSFKYLHKEIREKGGAYGGGAAGSTPGLFNFYSYRDPRCLETIVSFSDAIKWAVNGEYNDDDIDEAKLTVFQQLDKPISPGDMGMTLFLNGVTDHMREQHRHLVLDVQRSHLQDVASRYLSSSEYQVKQGYHAVTILGPHNSLLDDSLTWTVKKQDK